MTQITCRHAGFQFYGQHSSTLLYKRSFSAGCQYRCRSRKRVVASGEEQESWFNYVPRIKFRRAQDRAKEQLAELAILNEKLAGSQPWEIRKKIDSYRGRRKNWSRIYDYLIANEFQATLNVIMEASEQVDATLNQQVVDSTSIEEQEMKLLELQRQLRTAYERLRILEARVDVNRDRVGDLKMEAQMLEQEFGETERVQAKIRRQLPPLPESWLEEGAEIEAPEQVQDLEQCWYPIAFSSKLTGDTFIPFDLFNYPWVIFQNSDGDLGCIKDECAHRACPLSLGKIIEGEIQCPYHGFQFDIKGNCTKMPSTRFIPGLCVPNAESVERDGFIWIRPQQPIDTSEQEGNVNYRPPTTLNIPKDLQVCAEVEMTVDVDQGLLMQHLLDLAHAPMSHTPVFTKEFNILDFVSMQSYKYLMGQCELAPLDVVYEPPCTLISTFQFKRTGQILHQIHVCLPAMKGKSRVLYRIATQRGGYGLWQEAWERVATQCLHDDLMFVQWQHARLLRQANK